MATKQPTPIQESKLAKNPTNSNLTKSLDDLWAEANKLKAKDGAKRLELVCNIYDQLSAETTYRWIDPIGFQHEVEDSLSHKVSLLHILRNCVSVLPLILTWIALYLALTAYQQDTYTGDGGKSFLQLWQEGFHGGTPLTFSTAAAIDIVLLIFFVVLIAITSWFDSHAYSRSTRFAQKLQSTTEGLMRVVDSIPSISIDKSAITNVANAVQQVVNDAMKANQQLIRETMEASRQATESAEKSFRQFIEKSLDTLTGVTQTSKDTVNQIVQISQKAIQDSNDRADKIFTRTNSTLGTFEVNVTNLQTVLTNYQLRLNDLQNAIQELTTASGTLTTYSNDYLQVGKKINENIDKLTQAHNNVLQQMKVISQGVNSAASDMNHSADNLQSATQAVEKVANQLDTGIKTTLDAMTDKVKTTMDNMVTDISKATNTMNTGVQQTVQIMGAGVQHAAAEIRIQVENAVISLRDLTPALQTTVDSLDKATEKLSNISAGVNGSGGTGGGSQVTTQGKKAFPIGGFLGWLLRR
jgi:methyl-accepting chemotaxis protein